MHNIKRKIAELGAAASIGLSLSGVAHAQNRDLQKPGLTNPSPRAGSFGDLLVTVINALLLFAGAIAVLFLIIGGFRYIISSGSPEQVEGAKKTILYALLGLIIIFIAYILVQVVQTQLGVDRKFKV